MPRIERQKIKFIVPAETASTNAKYGVAKEVTMSRFVVSLLLVAFGAAIAQAPATSRTISADLVFALLGGMANSIAIEVPEEVKHLYLSAVQDGEVLFEHDRKLTGTGRSSVTVTVTAGSIGNTSGCPLKMFLHSALEDAEGVLFASGTTVHCRHNAVSDVVRPAYVKSPLRSLSLARELPYDRWLALEAVSVDDSPAIKDPESLDGVVVFYLYLSTGADGVHPPAPEYVSQDEIFRAFGYPSEGGL